MPSRHALIIALAALLLAALAAGCAGKSEPYEPPESISRAAAQRQKFANSFLQGRWCEAAALFENSVTSFLRRDDFCAASANFRLAWKLKAYLGMDDPALAARAESMAAMGLDCPAVPEDPKDKRYEALIERRDFHSLASALSGESDPLFASVYGRKGAEAALEAGKTGQARGLLEATRKIDAEHSWVLFLAEDWKLAQTMETDPARREAMGGRAAMLEGLIEPCGGPAADAGIK